MGFIAAIDQGTTSTRCIVFDQRGRVRAIAQREHRQIYPRPGWVEHDPEEIWQATTGVITEAIGAADVTIDTVGITNQRETIVFWDVRSGRALANAIVWQDTRTAALCERLAADAGPSRFARRTGLPLATYFSGPKIRWALDNLDEVRDAAARGVLRCGTIESWIIWKLTGRHITDVTNASRTMLMNLNSLDWDDEMLAAFEIPRSILPEIVASSVPGGYAMTPPDGPFGRPIPVSGAIGDQQAALLGQCCVAPGDAKNTYGTGCFLLLNTGTTPTHSKHGLLSTVAWRLGDAPAVYALEGSVAIAGALIQWLRDNLGLIDAAAEIESLAREVDDTGSMYIVPAFSGLFAPRWRADARGVIVGLTRFIDRRHIARAALEATCYQTREVLDAMREDSGIELAALKVDGGMSVNDLLLQMQADILGCAVVRPKITETTALGAAWAAGLAEGLLGSPGDLAGRWEMDRRFEPQIDEASRSSGYAGWLRAVERSLGWVTAS